MKHKGILTAAIIVVTVSLVYIFLKTSAITGYVVQEQAPLCEGQDDCTPDEACCLFAGKVAGVCYGPEYCDQIATMTAKEYVEYLHAGAQGEESEETEEQDYYTTLAATVVLLIGLLTVIYLIAIEERSKQKSFFS